MWQLDYFSQYKDRVSESHIIIPYNMLHMQQKSRNGDPGKGGSRTGGTRPNLTNYSLDTKISHNRNFSSLKQCSGRLSLPP